MRRGPASRERLGGAELRPVRLGLVHRVLEEVDEAELRRDAVPPGELEALEERLGELLRVRLRVLEEAARDDRDAQGLASRMLASGFSLLLSRLDARQPLRLSAGVVLVHGLEHVLARLLQVPPGGRRTGPKTTKVLNRSG